MTPIKTTIEEQKDYVNSYANLYPIALPSLNRGEKSYLDTTGIASSANVDRASHHAMASATAIAYDALIQWNEYIVTDQEHYRHIFMKQVQWFVHNEKRINETLTGWSIFFPTQVSHSHACLSAATQGCVLSVLIRAYQVTGEEEYATLMQRVVNTFQHDILDGGVNTPVGDGGIFFEDVASYPASHSLHGCMLGLLGLYEYTKLTSDNGVKQCIQRCLYALDDLLNEYDTGFWTYTDLLHHTLASDDEFFLQTQLLEEIAFRSGHVHYSQIARHWKNYRYRRGSRLQRHMSSFGTSVLRTLGSRIRSLFFCTPQPSSLSRVCIPIHAFPVTGGTRAVLSSIAEVMSDRWQIEYLTQYVGPNPDHLTIHKFGTRRTTPWQFPLVLLYSIAGFWKLMNLMRRQGRYHLILPQDGVFTSAFAALAAKFVGVRVVCIDHGNLTLLHSQSYYQERVSSIACKEWPSALRLLARIFFIGYLPALSLLAKLSALCVDHYLIPGVAGDGTEEICKDLGIPTSRITRFGSMIDTDQYCPLTLPEKTAMRFKHTIPSDAILIAMTCRLAPEKGIEIALAALSRVVSELTSDVRIRVRVIIAGDGPLRTQVEERISSYGLDEICILWGETAPADVISLLGMSDIFLYTSVRGACLSMAVLEAMASRCAVIASMRPLSNKYLLAEGRGIAIQAEDVNETYDALLRLVNDQALCRQMGQLSRDYTMLWHSPSMFQRVLMRATYWSGRSESGQNG